MLSTDVSSDARSHIGKHRQRVCPTYVDPLRCNVRWVKSRHCVTFASCLLYPRKQTLAERVGMSVKCQKRTKCAATNCQLLDRRGGGCVDPVFEEEAQHFLRGVRSSPISE
jgi:hypothetical protein